MKTLPELVIGKLQPKYPIIQGGMAVRLSTADLAAAVANAGGIGLIAATGMDEQELREEIRKARSLTDGIIGINIMFAYSHFELIVKVAIDEGIDLIVQGAGFSRDIFKWCKESNTEFVPIVASAKLAKTSEKLGAAAVVVEGKEAGGHLGTDREMYELLEEIADAVTIPVIAAGGIMTASDMQKAFEKGAKGVQLGTIFAATKEAAGADALKEVYIKATKEDIVLIDSPVGLKGQAIRNEFTEKIARGEATPTACDKCLKKCSMNFCILQALNNAQQGNLKEGLIFSGENIEYITEILPAKEVVNRLVSDFEKINN